MTFVSHQVIGQHIRDARKAKALTQAHLAEQLGISTLHYGRLERGDRPASLEQLAHIASLLDVPTLSLLNGCLPHEPYFDDPTAESLAFAERLSRMTARCTNQELGVLEEICALFSQKNTAC